MNLENIPPNTNLENIQPAINISIDSNSLSGISTGEYSSWVGELPNVEVHDSINNLDFERVIQEAVAQYAERNPWFAANPMLATNTDGIIHIHYEDVHSQEEQPNNSQEKQPNNSEEWMELLK